MINLTREEAQQILDVLEGSIDAQQWEINDHVTKYGEWYRPQRVEYMKQQLANTNSIIETIRAKLSEPEPEPVAYLCENAVGHKYFRWKKPQSIYKPIALYTASPQRKECQRCGEVNPAEIHTCTPQREWQGLTDDELSKTIDDVIGFNSCVGWEADFARVIETKLKEKNT